MPVQTYLTSPGGGCCSSRDAAKIRGCCRADDAAAGGTGGEGGSGSSVHDTSGNGNGGCCTGKNPCQKAQNTSTTRPNPPHCDGNNIKKSCCSAPSSIENKINVKACCDNENGTQGCCHTQSATRMTTTTSEQKDSCNSGGHCRSAKSSSPSVDSCCADNSPNYTCKQNNDCCDTTKVEEGGCCSSKEPAAKQCCVDNGGNCSKSAKESKDSSCCSSKGASAGKSCCSTKTKSNPAATVKPCCSEPVQDGCFSSNIQSAAKSCCGDSGEGSCSSSAKQYITNISVSKSCCDDVGESDKQNNSVNKGKSCCDEKGVCRKRSSIKTLTCLAVVRPDNAAVDVFDTKGRLRTFRFNSNNKRMKALLSEKKICFSTHGAGADLLTPCFDRYGQHDEPEEGCPCGVEEPHLHAHVHDSEICGMDGIDSSSRSGVSSSAAKKKVNWRFLSQLTLYPDDAGDKEQTTSYLPITQSMPKECNSKALNNHLTERGLKLTHWLRWRNAGRKDQTACCTEDKYCGVSCKSHRLYPVQHEDHTDFLIHNETTGDLHMEHPNCADCGENDIHGRFRLAHTRSWAGDGNNNEKCKISSPQINLHFFEVHEEPFRLLDVLAGMFELESSRVHAARAVVEEPLSRVGRSQFYVKEICCASEIPQIESILIPIEGVVEVSINTTTRMVYVDHDVDILSANAISTTLNNEGFGAVIKKDGVVEMDQMAGIPTDIFVESRFDLTSETNESDRTKVGDVIRACLDQKFSLKEVKEVSLIEEDNVVTIQHNPYYITAPGIVEILASHMFDVKIVTDGGADGLWALSSMKEDTEDTIEHHHATVRWTVVLSGVFWVISMFSLLAKHPNVSNNVDYLKYVALLSVAFGLPPIAVKAFRTLRRFRFDVNCMMLFAAVGALPLQEYTEAAAVTFLFAISESLETRATARARNALSAIVCLRPEHANAINPITKQIVVLPANCVAVGTTVSVRPGDKIACDGVVIEGKSTVDESSLTGESRPVNKSVGMKVSGGTINTGSMQLVIKTTATSSNSAVARLIRLIEEAQSNRSETEKMVDSFAKIYTPIVVLVAFCMCTIPWAFGVDTGIFWAKTGLVTMVIACPCALIISTPVTYVAALAQVYQKGIIVKGGQHLEGLGRVKSIAFDKTGTLSQGVFALLHLDVVGQTRSRQEVLGLLALVEAPASHPLSNALVKGAENEKIDIPRLQLQNHTLLPGEGITAVVAGKNVHVGNKKLFQRLCLYDDLPEEVKAKTDEWADSGGTIGFISIEGEGIIGAYCVADRIREEAKDVVEALKKMGIEITMLTGDQRPAALGIGGQIGLDEQDIRSELLPEDKMIEIGDKVREYEVTKKCWMAKRSAMMCGDGVNDAPALALADISVAMGEGAALAMDTADVTLMDSNLNKLLYIIKMGRRVIRTIIENVAFSLIVKAIVMGFTFAGKASLWAAIAADVGAMLIVTLNGMKLLPSSRNVKKNELSTIGSGEMP